MATPVIQTFGSVSGFGIAGRDREGLPGGQTITLSDTEPANVGATYLWQLLDTPIGTSILLNNPTSATTCNFILAGASLEGSYKIRCEVNGTDVATVIISVPLPNLGSRIPTFGEQLDYLGPSLTNVKGWHQAITLFMRAVDSNIGVFSALGLNDVYQVGQSVTANAGVSVWTKAVDDASSLMQLIRSAATGSHSINGLFIQVSGAGAAASSRGLEVNDSTPGFGILATKAAAGWAQRLHLSHVNAQGLNVNIAAAVVNPAVLVQTTQLATGSLVKIDKQPSGSVVGTLLELLGNANVDAAALQFVGATLHGDVALVLRAADPANAAEGEVWWNTTTKQLKYHNGTTVVAIGSVPVIGTTTVVAGPYAASVGELIRADPTGGGFTINFPAVASANKDQWIVVKNFSDVTDTLTLNPDGSDTLDGLTTILMNTPREALTFVSDGVSDWTLI